MAELYEKTEGIISAIQILERGRKDCGFKDFEEILAGYYIRNSQPEKALELTQHDLTKARALFDLGKNDEGFEILKHNQENYKNDKTFHALLAQYYFQQGMSKDAFKEIDEYAKLDPNSPLIYQMRALIYEKLEDSFNEASEFYERLVDVDPKNKNALQKLAEFRESIGDNYGAMEYMDKLKELDPRNQFVADNYEKYKNGSENSGFGAFFKKIFGKRMG